MQQELIAGDSLNFSTSVPDYLPDDGWVLKYRLVPRTASGSAIDITATAVDSDFVVQIAASITNGWGSDTYTWISWVEKGAEVYTIDDGQIVVRPNPRTLAAGFDGRSQAQKALEDLKTAFATFSATQGMVKRYAIAGREMEFNSASEILKQIAFWEAQLAAEQAAEALAKGLKPKNRILTRFTRPR